MTSFKTILLSAGLISYSLLGCNFPNLGIYPDRARIHAKGNYGSGCEANKENIDTLLSNLWHSGFLKQSEDVRQEILNNKYGVLNESSELGQSSDEELTDAIDICKRRRNRGCFINREGSVDYLILKERLFCHLEYDRKGNTKYKSIDEKAEKTLLHELFHDFWHNSLDLDKKLEFALVGEIFYNEMLLAKTDDEKLKFLRKIGFTEPELEDFEAYGKLKKKKELYKAKSREFFGTELYSILADKAFTREIIIPKQLRKFYEMFVSEKVLSGGRVLE